MNIDKFAYGLRFLTGPSITTPCGYVNNMVGKILLSALWSVCVLCASVKQAWDWRVTRVGGPPRRGPLVGVLGGKREAGPAGNFCA
ncbi:hypothetical protein A2Z00_04110 [Candidatus Gottesmanbacteria bacterium RBG_13_45_10]|uniref:Uncharacterized protein n=1 Tax=Candidatus Gottesmanbacteria bacterium RBG_13_45_10 TaxID=1798370 RepID=A0A1F5ZIL5_9BACT|nr:MAG: hypothetical protein A2Z00_04110 [Candidatus Gottesmanbacteria bacterium RBG_13_45_10]